MKTLENHTILFDADCPMCNLYSKAFIGAGMLDNNGRAPYQDMPEATCTLVDRQRAVNEIALVNNETGEVSYGIQSLFIIIGNSFPLFKPLFSLKPFIWVMSKAYAFISYNRRVIIPAPAKDTYAFKPSFRLGYRLAYLLFTWVVTAFVLTAYAKLLKGTVPVGNEYREYLVCGGQIIFQGIVVSVVAPKVRWDYLGNMMTISFAGALLLLPGLLVSSITELPSVAYAAYFMGVAGLMFLEHIRRTKLLGLGITLTISWAVFRLIVLVIILNQA